MRSRIALAAAVSAVLALGASTPQGAAAKSPLEEPPAKQQCFWAQQVVGFASSDDRYVQVRVGVKNVYQFEMFGRCPNVDWTQRILIVSRGGNRICEGFDAELITPSQIGPQRCLIRNVHKLSPEQVAALPSRARP